MFEQFFENINYVYNWYYLRKNYTFKNCYYFLIENAFANTLKSFNLPLHTSYG